MADDAKGGLAAGIASVAAVASSVKVASNVVVAVGVGVHADIGHSRPLDPHGSQH